MEQIVIPQVTENDDAGLLVKQGQRALHEEGNLHASRHWFDRAFRAAERDGDLEAMGQAAIGLSGLWVYEHHSTEPWAQVLSRQRQTLDLLPPGSLLSLQLRARLAAEADYQAGRSSQIFAVLAEARHREDPHTLATTLSLAHHCVLGPEHGRLRQALADELLLTATRTEYPSDRLMGLLWKTVDLFLDGSPHGERSLTELTLANAGAQHQAIGFTIEAMQVMLAVRAGDFDRAEAMAAQCLLTGQGCGDIDAIAWYQAQLTSIRWFQGRVGELMPMIRQHVHAPDRGAVDNSQFAALAALAALDGDYRLAAGALARIGRGDLTQVRPSSGWLGTLHGAVEAAFLIGDAEIAASAYNVLSPFAGLPVMASLAVTCFGSVEHALGLASLTVGEIDRAVTHLQQAVRQNLALGHWPAACLSRFRLAEALAARDGAGDAEQAAQHLADARREANDLKMTLPPRKSAPVMEPAIQPVAPVAGSAQAGPEAEPVQVRLLGPVDLKVAGTIRPISGLRRKAVLAVLALHVGEVVSADHLIEVVWGEHAPLTATNTLQSHISHLRRVLGRKDAIRSRSTGYILDLDGEATDVVAAERLIRAAGASTDLAHRARQLQAAIELWRGRALMDVIGPVRLDEQAERLNQLLFQARQTLAEVRLALGRHLEVVDDLEPLTREYPLHEPIHGQLMLALYRAGRPGDALAVYRRLRSSLSDDLGLDPSQPVRSLEQAILQQDAGLDLRLP